MSLRVDAHQGKLVLRIQIPFPPDRFRKTYEFQLKAEVHVEPDPTTVEQVFPTQVRAPQMLGGRNLYKYTAVHDSNWDQNRVLGVWAGEARIADEHSILFENGAEKKVMCEVKRLSWSCRAMSGRRCCVCGRKLTLSELTWCKKCGRIYCSVGLCGRSHWCKASARGTQHPGGTRERTMEPVPCHQLVRDAAGGPFLCGQIGGDARDVPEGFVVPPNNEDPPDDEDEEESEESYDTDVAYEDRRVGTFMVDAPWTMAGRRWRRLPAPMPLERIQARVEPFIDQLGRFIVYARLDGSVMLPGDVSQEGDMIRVLWTNEPFPWTVLDETPPPPPPPREGVAQQSDAADWSAEAAAVPPLCQINR